MNYYAYETRYCGPTNSKGAKIKVREMGFDGFTAISYDYEHNILQNHQRAAMATHSSLAGKDLEIVSTKSLKKGYLVIGVMR